MYIFGYIYIQKWKCRSTREGSTQQDNNKYDNNDIQDL